MNGLVTVACQCPRSDPNLLKSENRQALYRVIIKTGVPVVLCM